MKRGPRPYWRGIRAYWYWIAIAVLLIFQWVLYPPVPVGPAVPSGPQTLAEGIHEVRRVVDGDTLLLESGARVRLKGIDTPETVREDSPVEQWGPEASRFTKNFVRQAGGRVRLTFGTERLDDYGRYLAFAWDGDTMLNEELVRAGLAHTRLGWRFNSSLKRRLRLAQEEAQRAKRGLWSDANAATATAAP